MHEQHDAKPEHASLTVAASDAAVILHAAAFALTISCWNAGMWVLCVPLWCAIAWLDHASLTRLHDAIHGLLHRWKLRNEIEGVIIGTASLTPMSVYRYMHAQHHAHLGRERDPEFRPYNQPETSRSLRLIYAWTELVIGWIFTPLLYNLRTAARWRSLPPQLQRRLILEWTILAVFWIALAVVLTKHNWWEPFLIAHLIPAWLAGTMQTIRKFTEHLGMHGDSILTMTRTVVYQRKPGKALSATQRFVDHHGTHHRHARIPSPQLPQATTQVYGRSGEAVTFKSHLAAMKDMLPHLLDPKLGPQWTEPKPA